MYTDTTKIANELLKLSFKDGIKLRPNQLNILTYVSYGYGLGIDFHEMTKEIPIVSKFGPIFMSLFYSTCHFKKYVDEYLYEFDDPKMENPYIPKFHSEDYKKIIEIVWKRYKIFSSKKLFDIFTHNGNPYSFMLHEGVWSEIPMKLTKVYYKEIINRIIKY